MRKNGLVPGAGKKTPAGTMRKNKEIMKEKR
ncbi:MAG: hypothetical protein ACJAUE_000541 [Alcanivorax sp.]|jgi:hypothetical protein